MEHTVLCIQYDRRIFLQENIKFYTKKYFHFPLSDFTSRLTHLQKAASVTIRYTQNIYFMLQIEVEFMFYKIHTYMKTSGINKQLTVASPTPIFISEVTFRSPRILLSKKAILSVRTHNKFYYSVCMEEPCTMRSVACVGSAWTLSTPLTKIENFDISHVPFIH